MREMKFRVWDSGEKKWVLDWDHFWPLWTRKITRDEIESPRTFDVNFRKAECPPLIVQQWTGLKDKNKKEIFEGDILDIHWDESIGEIVDGQEQWKRKHRNERAYVTWLYPGWHLTYITWLHDNPGEIGEPQITFMWDHTWPFPDHIREIIGNIFETPNLLKPS